MVRLAALRLEVLERGGAGGGLKQPPGSGGTHCPAVCWGDKEGCFLISRCLHRQYTSGGARPGIANWYYTSAPLAGSTLM